MSDKKRRDDQRGEPQWHPITMLEMIAMVVDKQVESLEEGYDNLNEARDKPHVLNDAIVDRAIELHTKVLDDAWVFEEQLARWKGEELTEVQKKEIGRFTEQMVKYRELCEKALALAQELKKGTIDSILRMSDEEVAMAVMMGKLMLLKS